MEISKIKINHEKDNLKIYFFLTLICVIIFLNLNHQTKQIDSIIHKLNSNYRHSEEIKFENKKEDYYMNLLSKKIKLAYKKNGFVNINEIESTINQSRPWEKNSDLNNEINLGFHIDKKFVLKCMITLASIMDSQNQNTKIRFHIALVGVDEKSMLKIYSLRNRIREDVEFNFYNAKRVETDLIGLNIKREGLNAKLIVPELLPNDVEKIFVLDSGDLLVIKDLLEVYHWDMKGCLYAGVPASGVGKLAKITNKTFEIYIGCGNFLADVEKVKKEKMFEKFMKYKNVYTSGIADQDLLNDIAFGKITYLPFKFGMICPFLRDIDAEMARKDNKYSFYIQRLKSYNNYTFLPKNEIEFLRMGYSPYVIHHMHSKWMNGQGLTVYRKLAQYYIRYAGIWEEVCKEFSGYCK